MEQIVYWAMLRLKLGGLTEGCDLRIRQIDLGMMIPQDLRNHHMISSSFIYCCFIGKSEERRASRGEVGGLGQTIVAKYCVQVRNRTALREQQPLEGWPLLYVSIMLSSRLPLASTAHTLPDIAAGTALCDTMLLLYYFRRAC